MGETPSVGGGTELGNTADPGAFFYMAPLYTTNSLHQHRRCLEIRIPSNTSAHTQAQAGTSPAPFTSSLLKPQTGASSLRSVRLS